MDFLAGCIGGCAGVVVGHPFDTVKVRLQTQDMRNPAYRSTFHCVQTLVKNDSIWGLFRGMSSPMAGVAVINAIVFGVQGNLQRRLPNPESLTSHFVAGFTAGVSQSVFCSPMELIKTQIQLQKTGTYKSPWDCLKQLYKGEGARGVFRGLGITAVREGPGFGFYFLAYELLTRNSGNAPISTAHMLMAGGAAGSISWLVAYPIDVIKTRFQVDGMFGPRMYKSAWDCCVQSVRTEGYTCLTRGLGLTLVRAFPVNAATWAAVSWTFRLAEGRKQQDTAYTKLSELRDSALYLPEISRAFHAQATRAAVPRRFWDQETLGRSRVAVCNEHIISFEHILNNIPRSLAKS